MHQGGYFRSRLESEKDRLDMGGERRVESYPVILLVRSRLLVFLDQSRRVIVGMADCGDSGLGMAVHNLAVKVNLRSVFAHQFAILLQLFEIAPRLLVDILAVGVNSFRQSGLGPYNPEETVRLGGDDLARLCRVEDVIRR